METWRRAAAAGLSIEAKVEEGKRDRKKKSRNPFRREICSSVF